LPNFTVRILVWSSCLYLAMTISLLGLSLRLLCSPIQPEQKLWQSWCSLHFEQLNCTIWFSIDIFAIDAYQHDSGAYQPVMLVYLMTFRFFSYEHFYVIYCKFWELDLDHDFLIDKDDLLRYGNHALTFRIVERIFSQVYSYSFVACLIWLSNLSRTLGVPWGVKIFSSTQDHSSTIAHLILCVEATLSWCIHTIYSL
jgi:hypothetical protein